MKKFQYAINRVPIDANVEEVLNFVGAQGWEVIDTRYFHHYTEFLMKRDMTDEEVAVSELCPECHRSPCVMKGRL